MLKSSCPWGSRVVVKRRWQTSPGARSVFVFRPRLEALEERMLLSAGDLDTSFGTGGKVITDFGAGSINTVDTLAVQPDGKILVAGHTQASTSTRSLIALALYNSDGSLDLGFGAAGKVTTDFGPLSAQAVGLCVEPSGTIIVVGQEPPSGIGDTVSILLAAYNPDGTPDLGFGTAGKVVDSVSVRQPSFLPQVTGVACQPDGKILVGAGCSSTAQFSNGGPTSILRYNMTAVGTQPSVPRVLLAFPTTRATELPSSPMERSWPAVEHIYLLRLNTDGSPDLTFGSGGLALGNLTVELAGAPNERNQEEGRSSTSRQNARRRPVPGPRKVLPMHSSRGRAASMAPL